jgi:hypothetical protein
MSLLSIPFPSNQINQSIDSRFTLPRILPTRDRIGNRTILDPIQEAPAARTLGTPHEIATRRTLKDIHLRLDEFAYLLDHVIIPGVKGRGLALAARDGTGCPCRGGSVGVDADVGRGAPFAHVGRHDGVRFGEVGAPFASLVDVAGLIEAVVVVCEELVQVRVDAKLLVRV